TIEGYVITNKHVPETTVAEGKKTWIEENEDPEKVRPVKITIRLFADGKEIDAKTVTKEDGWKWKWENLPKYKDGKEIKYTIKEDRVKNYLTKIEGFDVTNTFTTETGDTMQPWLWIGLLGVALLLCGGLLALEWINRRTE
ncbi:MAG: Cna B-type domain-containing protein, partial [Clostridia bacterium]|nr:Cna B-type domain-containing protein [Clostridia bacterium]